MANPRARELVVNVCPSCGNQIQWYPGHELVPPGQVVEVNCQVCGVTLDLVLTREATE